MQLLTYLALAYPMQKPWENDSRFEEIVIVWHNILYVFPSHIAKQAVDNYLHQGKAFYPSLAEIVSLADEAWRREVESNRTDNIQAERDAAKLLFHAPLNTFAQGYPRKSVVLIRKVIDREIKFMSEDWKQEFKAIYGADCSPETGFFGTE